MVLLSGKLDDLLYRQRTPNNNAFKRRVLPTRLLGRPRFVQAFLRCGRYIWTMKIFLLLQIFYLSWESELVFQSIVIWVLLGSIALLRCLLKDICIHLEKPGHL